jgi:hypothetical protein
MAKSIEKTVFMICPVRNATPEEKIFLEEYMKNLESKGYKVYYPPRDTNQNDPIGLNICSENRAGIRNSDEIHIYWNPGSSGSGFDFGMVFMAEKPIKLINKDKIPKTLCKSFENVLLELDSRYKL